MEETSINLVEVRERKQIAEKTIAAILEEFITDTKTTVVAVDIDVRSLKKGGHPLVPKTSKTFLVGVEIKAGYEI